MKKETYIPGFFSRIYRSKQLISMHSLISENSEIIRHQNFFGFLQGSLFLRQVYNETFIILNGNRRRGITIDQIIDKISDSILREQHFSQLNFCRKAILNEARKTVRDKEICHFDDFDLMIFQNLKPDSKLDYNEVFQILIKIEELLTSLSSDNCPSIQYTIQDFINHDPATQDLKNILEYICVQEYA
jgi:hypothetical protein